MMLEQACAWLQRHADNTSMPGAREAYRTILDALERVRWIPVEESKSKNNYEGNVLCYVPKRKGCLQNGVFQGVKIKEEWGLLSWYYFEHPIVTHWMPLPKPPEVEP